MIAGRDITGVILCGGAGSRMGGVDKPLVLAGDVPLVGRVQTRLAPQVHRVVIACNRNEAAYRAWADEVVCDAIPWQGPLSGIASALERVTTPFAVVCPGDVPYVSTDLAKRLAAVMRPGIDVAVAHDGERVQPLFMLLRVATRAAIGAYLRRGARSVRGWLEASSHEVVDMADERASFFNVNTPDDLAKVRNDVVYSR